MKIFKNFCTVVFLGIMAWTIPAQAQEGQKAEQLKMTPSPVVVVEKIRLNPVDENANVVGGMFSIDNQEDKDFFDLYEEIKVYRLPDAPQEGETVDPNQFSLENWTLVATAVNSDNLVVRKKEKKQRAFSINLPKNHPAGSYLVQINLFQKDYAQTGAAMSDQFNLAGNNNFLKLSGLEVVRDGKSYGANAGIDFGAGEMPQLFLKMKNLGAEEIRVVPKLIIFERNQFGKQSAAANLKEYSIKAGEEAAFSEKIAAVSEPGSYLAQVQFFENEGSDPVSAPVYLRFVVRGESGKILEISADKDQYKKGDLAKVDVTVVGSADTTIRDAQGNVILNPERQSQGDAALTVSITDKSGMVQSVTKKISLQEMQVVALDVPVQNNTQDFKLRAVLEKDGKVLSEKEISVVTKKDVTGKDTKMIVMLAVLIGVLFLAVVMLVVGLRKRHNLTMLLVFIFAISVFAITTKSAHAQLIENWSSPADGAHYNQTSDSADNVLFSATPVWQSCSNGATTGTNYYSRFYVNDQVVAYNTGFSMSTYQLGMGNAKMGANSVYFTADFGGFGVKTSSTRTIYMDTGQINVSVFYQNCPMCGLNYIVGATVNCNSRTLTTNSFGRAIFYSISPANYSCTVTAPGYVSQSKNIDMNNGRSTNGNLDFILAAAPAPTCTINFTNIVPGSFTAEFSTTDTTSATYGCTGPYSAADGTPITAGSYPIAVSSGGTETCTAVVTGPGGSETCTKSGTVLAPAGDCALPWGGTIASGASVTAHGAGCGGSCPSETRVCTNGVLSGTYTGQSCPACGFQCTNFPSNATASICSQDNTGLTANTPATVVASSSACSGPPVGSEPKCEYYCKPGFTKDGNRCVCSPTSTYTYSCIDGVCSGGAACGSSAAWTCNRTDSCGDTILAPGGQADCTSRSITCQDTTCNGNCTPTSTSTDNNWREVLP